MRRGFTLTELLVVVAIIAVLAAILMPVLIGARERAWMATCASNLKQIGEAFLLYAPDYDDRLPTPGGRAEYGPNGVCESPRNGWVQSSGPGLGKDAGGIFPYIRFRSNIPGANPWCCPKAKPGTRGAWSPGQNYVMNDYLRMGYPGEGVTRIPDCRCGSPYRPCPGYFDGVPTGTLPNAAEVILVFEAAQKTDGSVARNGSPYFSTAASSAHPPVPANAPAMYHLGACNLLFTDGHVKAMKPYTTWTNDSREQASHLWRYNARYADLLERLGHGVRGGPVDLWDPQLPGVVYP